MAYKIVLLLFLVACSQPGTEPNRLHQLRAEIIENDARIDSAMFLEWSKAELEEIEGAESSEDMRLAVETLRDFALHLSADRKRFKARTRKLLNCADSLLMELDK